MAQGQIISPGACIRSPISDRGLNKQPQINQRRASQYLSCSGSNSGRAKAALPEFDCFRITLLRRISTGFRLVRRFLGLDLTITPWNILSGNFTSPLMWLPYMILPILVLILNFGSMQLTKILKPGYKEEQEAKKRAKLNPARKDQAAVDSTTEQTMKMMNWMMPLLMVWTTFTLPSAMGLYWFVGGLMGIISQLIVYVLFSRPYEKKKAELEAKKDAVFKKKPALEAAGAGEEVSGKGKKNGKKKK